jgi:hypothetical protein
MARENSCPYRRPFGEFFVDCPAYEPELYLPTSMRNVPLAPIWTCHHMTVGEDNEQPGHMYARCLVGDAIARREALFRKLRGPRAAA